MRHLLVVALGSYLTIASLAVWANTAIQRGEYLANLGGCHSCHSEQGMPKMAGGVVLATEFGTFYPPNITPDPEHGIGNWNQHQFNTAMRHGLNPDGEPYYPSFPYTSYTRMTDADLADLKVYLESLPPVAQSAPKHDLKFPFNIRLGLYLWQWFNFAPEPFIEENKQTAVWNRGAYIVTGPGHCGECHTPRTITLAMDADHHLQGNPNGPEGENVPSINMALRGDAWLMDDIIFALQIGMTPEGDFFGGSMAAVVDNTSLLSATDIEAIATYLANPDGTTDL